jgi:hypothetical protein
LSLCSHCLLIMLVTGMPHHVAQTLFSRIRPHKQFVPATLFLSLFVSHKQMACMPQLFIHSVLMWCAVCCYNCRTRGGGSSVLQPIWTGGGSSTQGVEGHWMPSEVHPAALQYGYVRLLFTKGAFASLGHRSYISVCVCVVSNNLLRCCLTFSTVEARSLG